MGVYTGTAKGEEFSIPLVPAGAGASGGGYGPVYVSLAVAKPMGAHIRLVGDGVVWDDKDVSLGEGRTLVAIAERKNDKSPSALIVKPQGAERVDWICEWERPPLDE